MDEKQKYFKTYYQKNRLRILTKQKEYNRKNRGKLREYERNRYWNGNNNEPSLKIRYGEFIVKFE
jgi:hypothetical protein